MTGGLHRRLFASHLLVAAIAGGALLAGLPPVAALAGAALLSLGLASLLAAPFCRALHGMTALAAEIGRGNFAGRAPLAGDAAVTGLARALNEMSAAIEGRMASVAAERNRLDAILRGMGEGLMVVDAGGVVSLVNPAFRTFFYLSEEVEGRPLSAITRHPSLLDAFRLLVETRNERVMEITLNLPEERTLLTHWVPLAGEREFRGVVAVFHDISDLKRLEKVRRDFVANVSHELRTPVTVIKGYAETLLSGALEKDPARAARFVEIMHTHAERLARLIGDLLALSELESGHLALSLSPLAVAGVVRQSCALLEEKAREKEIVVDWSGVEGAPPVLADPGRLEQVLINLVDNAIKYTPGGGAVAISAQAEDDLVRVSVADTGPGIPARDLPRLFERFYRVDAARSRDQGGTGLGLAIVKHIVQLHGGSVRVESTPGKGSAFSFTLKRG